MKNEQVLVAVYGTLKENGWNHPVLHDGRTTPEFVGTGRAMGYGIYGRGVPYAVTREDGRTAVEVYRVGIDTLLGPLDRLEGYPRHYDRRAVEITMDDGNDVTAWIYVYAGKREMPESLRFTDDFFPVEGRA